MKNSEKKRISKKIVFSAVVLLAASHTVAVDFQPVMFGGLLYADCRLDGFIDCHRKTSVHNSLESTKHPP